MKFPGRKPSRHSAFGVSQVTKRPRKVNRTDFPAGTDTPRRPTRHSKVPRQSKTAGARCEKLADFGCELAHGVAHVCGHLRMLARMLTVQRLERDRHLDVLDHAGAGDPEALSGVVVRPYPAVLAERSADDGEALALQ